MAHFHVVYDTCVLVPAPLRDLLLRVAEAQLVRASISEDIFVELRRVLVRDFKVPEAAAASLSGAIERTFPDSLVPRMKYEALEGTHGLPDTNDEHVVAAARSVGAQAIVTANLKDFPAAILEPLEIEVLHPDEFMLDLVDLYPLKIARIIEEQASILRSPPMSYEQVLTALSRSIPESVARLREL